jgi:ZIP family zinc transporter
MVGSYVFVFLAGLVTALATGLGAVPFFFTETVSDASKTVLWGLASGIMVAASCFGLFVEGLAEGTVIEVAIGIAFGCVLVYVSHHILSGATINPKELPEADVRKLLLILGVLTVHSFPEGVAVGVSFAELNLTGGTELFGFVVPVLAIFMTIAISVHNIPEGLAVSIPLHHLGVRRWKLVWWSIFSSLPQPVGAVLAFGFVRYAEAFMPYGFGFAGGAMVYLVLTEFLPEAFDEGEDLVGSGWYHVTGGFVLGVLIMVPFLFL